MTDSIINIQNLSKSYVDHVAIDNIDLTIKHGEFITLLGPSGCGKTTLLRIIAGFEQPDHGRILLDGKDITEIPPEKRHVNLVFQNYALFPHMRVFDNIAFGLRCQKLDTDTINRRVNAVVALAHLEKFVDRFPPSLSGGQQQRVALARAIVNRPQVLLLDEPFSALDYSLRKHMRVELKQLQRDLGITFIFVTHDQEEALSMSDRIVIFNEGRIEQIGNARTIYEEPANKFTADFIGETNIFSAEIISANEQNIEVLFEDTQFTLKNKKQLKQDDKIDIIIRPEDFEVWDSTEATDPTGMLPGTIEEVIYKGSTVDLIVRLHSGKLISATEFFNEDDPNLIYKIGEKVWVSWPNGWEVILQCDGAQSNDQL